MDKSTRDQFSEATKKYDSYEAQIADSERGLKCLSNGGTGISIMGNGIYFGDDPAFKQDIIDALCAHIATLKFAQSKL